MILLWVFFLFLLFLFIFDYSLRNRNNTFVGFEVHQTPRNQNNIIVLNDPPKRTCKKTCKPEICTQYEQQLQKYHLCKECEENDQCYDPYLGRCMDCHDRQSCETTFGCEEGKPLDPVQSFCQPCWNHVSYAHAT